MIPIFVIIVLGLLALAFLETTVRRPMLIESIYQTENFVSRPADVRASTKLLDDVLSAKNGVSLSAQPPNAEGCAALDDSRTLELGGSYQQTTNNYQRTYPDSCSSLRHELVGSFYTSNATKPIEAGAPRCA